MIQERIVVKAQANTEIWHILFVPQCVAGLKGLTTGDCTPDGKTIRINEVLLRLGTGSEPTLAG